MVRAKFKCDFSKNDGNNGFIVSLAAVYDPDPQSENGQFFKATPSGQIRLGVVNEEIAKKFVPGQEYYIDFIPANFNTGNTH